MFFHRKQPRANRDHFPYPRGFKAAIDNEKKPASTGAQQQPPLPTTEA
jgi:hypothetical protein